MKKVQEFLKSKTMRMSLTLCMVAALACVSCFAADGDPVSGSTAITSAFQTGLSSFVSDAQSMLATLVVIALPLACTIFLARKALSWFKSLAK